MTHGSVTKVVKTFGSRWGRIRPHGKSGDVFFNVASLKKSADFAAIEVGQAVEFDETPDQVNGSHAEHMVLSGATPLTRVMVLPAGS